MQTYLSMLCVFKWGIFMFFAGMVGIMTLTVLFFYPETKGLPIEEAPHVFADHWCVAPSILSVNPTAPIITHWVMLLKLMRSERSYWGLCEEHMQLQCLYQPAT